MSANYTELKAKTDEIKEKLNSCARKLIIVKPKEKEKYENPLYRQWSGDIKDLEGFTLRLEEWLNQPFVAEAKRYLLDLKKWAESPKISLEEIEQDWRFLSDNVSEIKDIHTQIEDIGYENIKKKISEWVLNRISEKDIEKAKGWATNANKFANDLKKLENKKTESKLAEKVKRHSIDELLKITSFDKDNNEEISRYGMIISDVENIVKSKPSEVKEETILNTYNTTRDKKIEEKISIIRTEIKEIKTYLINLEWVKEFQNFKNYNKLWIGKQVAIKKVDLKSIKNALADIQQQADLWKKTHRKDIESALIRIERMANSVEKEKLKKDVVSLQEKIRNINWDKPDLKSIYDTSSQLEKLRKQLHEELIKKLQNEDAISIIEEPEIIEDLGIKKGWDFEKFITALKVVLRDGLIEIRAVEEK